MTEGSEEPLQGKLSSELKKEAPTLRLIAAATGVAAKLLVPSMLSASREGMTKYPGYKLLLDVGSTVEIGGAVTAATGKPEGAALYLAGKFTSLVAEACVREKEKTSKEFDKEPILVKGPALLAAAAAKVFLPSYLSSGEIKQPGYRTMLAGARLLEASCIGATVYGRGDIAAGTYVAGRTLALFAEVADRNMPFVKERLRGGLRRAGGKVKSLGVGLKKGAVVAGRETGNVVGKLSNLRETLKGLRTRSTGRNLGGDEGGG